MFLGFGAAAPTSVFCKRIYGCPACRDLTGRLYPVIESYLQTPNLQFPQKLVKSANFQERYFVHMVARNAKPIHLYPVKE